MQEKLHIWIDADSCPALVRNHTIKMATRNAAEVHIVANHTVKHEEAENVFMIICDSQKDAADDYIISHVEINDIVITKDIVFANRLIEKGICTINDRGMIFTAENIKERLSERDFSLQLSYAGVVKHTNEGYDKKKFALFANSFDKVLHQQLRKSAQKS